MDNSTQSNDQAVMAEFADNLWRNYIKPKYEDASMSTVSFYRATVIENRGSRILSVQRPYDEPKTVSCTNELSEVEPGAQVAVLKFGNGTAAMNHLAFMALQNNGISNGEEIEQDLADLRDELEAQIDAKIDTWAQEANPANSWTAEERASHNDDLWYYTGTTVITVGGVQIKPTGTYKYDATTNTWVPYSMQSDNLFDKVDGKSTVWYGSPDTPRTGVNQGDYLVDDSDGSTYRWDGDEWLSVTDYSAAISSAISALKALLEAQIDAKIETWAQESNPATAWTTSELRSTHNGDMWYYTGLSTITVGGTSIEPTKTYQYNGTNDTWSEYDSPSTSLFDMADGKTTIYYGSPTGTYTGVEQGDYLVDPNTGNSYQWTGSAWSLVQNLQVSTQLLDAYALCQTGASTAAKTATIEPAIATGGYSLVSGAKVTVLFTNTNTASNPTLSVNGTAAKRIVAYSNDTTFNNDYAWAAYSAVSFVYNGTYWVMSDPTAVAKAAAAQTTANSAQSTANSANALATATNNYFFHDSAGAHVATQAGNANLSQNVLINGNGMYVRDGTNLQASYTSTGVGLYADGTEVASFNSSSISLGKNSDWSRIQFCNDRGVISAGRLTYGSRIDYGTNVTYDQADVLSYLSETALVAYHKKGSAEEAVGVTAHADADSNNSYVEISGNKNVNIYATSVKANGSEVVTQADASTTTPLADGTASAGTSTDYARADHVHPAGISGLTQYGVVYATSATSVGSTAAGTTGYFLRSRGTSQAPGWTAPADMNVGYAGYATSAGSADTAAALSMNKNAGSQFVPVFFLNGLPYAITYLSTAYGGTGAADPSDARTNLSTAAFGTASDLNSITESGIFSFDNSTSNRPNTSYNTGGMVVNSYVGPNVSYQIAVQRNGTVPHLFARVKSSGSWGSWKEFA